MKTLTRSSFLRLWDGPASHEMWAALKAQASYIITVGDDETIAGDRSISLSRDEMIALEDAVAAKKEPYGDVSYADPGYQADKKKRYPIDTEGHIRAAWSYINQAKNHKGYSSGQVARIKSRIVSAWKRVIDKSGPPSAA